MGKLIHLALPVRLTHATNSGRGNQEMACTYDIHPRGARLLSPRDITVGDLITVERGRHKAVCRVVWTADRDSKLRGQFTVECVEAGKSPWEEELRQMEEQYLPVVLETAQSRRPTSIARRGEENRRRRPRFFVEGSADVSEVGGKGHVEGQIRQLSEFGCLVAAKDMLLPGTDLRLLLNIFDVSVALKGQVKYTAKNAGMGVEFQEIRQGDRPLLSYLLGKLATESVREFAHVEVVTESPTAIAG